MLPTQQLGSRRARKSNQSRRMPSFAGSHNGRKRSGSASREAPRTGSRTLQVHPSWSLPPLLASHVSSPPPSSLHPPPASRASRQASSGSSTCTQGQLHHHHHHHLNNARHGDCSPCCPKPRYYSIITSSGDEMACNKNGSIADFLLSRPLTHMHLCSSRMQPLSPFTAHRFATGRLPSRPPGSYPTCHLQPSCPGCFLHSIACTEKRYEFLLHRCYDSQPQVELSE